MQTLLLVWTLLGDHIKDAKVASIDTMGFEFELTDSKGKTSIDRYEFDSDGKTALSDAAAVKKEVEDLLSKSKMAVLPMNLGVLLTLFLWLLLLCGTTEKQGVGSNYVQILQRMAHSIFQSADNTIKALLLLIIAHACESVYAWYLLSQVNLSKLCKLSWCALVFVFGYPVTKQTIFLNKYGLKHKKEE